jgi:CRISPR-associated protein (TIGR03986 family)
MTPWNEQVRQNRFTREAGIAPYNFVPLPETVVGAPHLPNHDLYLEQGQGYSGWFEVKLETRSPVYVRGMLTMEQFLRQESNQYVDTGDPLPEKNPEFRRLAKNVPDFFYTRDAEEPVIPGSSLRGMLHSLVEIITYSKLEAVNASPKVFFRSVGGEDSLHDRYQKILGTNGRNVQVGFLVKDKKGNWRIQPAKRPYDLDHALSKKPYLKIEDNAELAAAVPGLLHLQVTEEQPTYFPQYHRVKFKFEQGKQGLYPKLIAPTRSQEISQTNKAVKEKIYDGILICSGNMLETGDVQTATPRKYFVLVVDDFDPKLPAPTIPRQALADYLDALTPFQKQAPFDLQSGCLVEGRPVFYIADGDRVTYFGYSPNFRIPALLNNKKRAATPLDFVPEVLRDPAVVDMAEAMFGYVKPKIDKTSQGDKKRAYASRVMVSEAVLEAEQKNIWLLGNQQDTLVPKILATPKATAFQNYLVQTSDQPRQLKHYGSPTPDETVVRGHKLYWHQGDPTPEHLKPISGSPSVDADGNVDERSTQHTQIKPLRSGVTFKFAVHFENLNAVELGALWWALTLPGDPQKEYCHSLGMGKPLGMGAVKLTPTLHFINRQVRYETLFAEDGWQSGEQAAHFEIDPRKRFEQYVLQLAGETETLLTETPRIRRLLKMMEWKSNPDLAEKQYMGLEGYQQRYVLPDPLDVK